MKPKKMYLYALLAFAFFSCNKSPLHETTGSHIKFFGFVLVDTFWDDPSDNEPKTNYIDEVYSFSNIADLLVLNPSDNIVGRIDAIANLQMKSILHVSTIFFEQVGTAGQSGASYNLRNDYQERWDELVTTNQLLSNQTKIQAFYVGEEPTWNDISFSELKAATDYIKAAFPTIPILIIEASTAVNSLQIPNSVDWIGFDHYFIKDPNSNAAFQNELNLLKSKINNSQHIVFVMDTHYITSIHGNLAGITLDEMKEVATNYYTLAVKEPKTIAILGYFWPSGFDNPQSVGARNMPQAVKDEYRSIGKQITQKE